MKKGSYWAMGLSGAAACGLSGFYGGAGGTVLVPMLEKLTDLPQQALFPTAIHMMLPICLTALFLSPGPIPWLQALPYLLGSLAGGLIAGKLKIPGLWLHRILGVLLLLGGGRLLWQ